MAASDFYTETHLGKLFLEDGHKGQDFKALPAGTPIPSPFPTATVVANYFDRYYGNVLAVQLPDSSYFGWAHMLTKSPFTVDTVIRADQTVGPVGNTGIYSKGPHVHTFRSLITPDPHAPVYKLVDPLPAIRTALTGAKPMTSILVAVTDGPLQNTWALVSETEVIPFTPGSDSTTSWTAAEELTAEATIQSKTLADFQTGVTRITDRAYRILVGRRYRADEAAQTKATAPSPIDLSEIEALIAEIPTAQENADAVIKEIAD